MSFQPRNKRLTLREIEVLQLVAEGDTSGQIAIKLNIGLQTVKNHRAHIYEKFEAVCAAQAVAIGIREGIIK